MQVHVKIFFINIFAFIISLHYALVLYSQSTYLTKYLGQENIWIVYSFGSFFTILLVLLAPSILKTFKISAVTRLVLISAFINLLFLPYYTSSLLIIPFTVLYAILSEFLILLPSIMLEHFSKNSSTGGIRGVFIASQSGAFVLAPFLSSIIIRDFGIETIFSFSALIIFIASLFFYFTLRGLGKLSISNKDFGESLEKVFKNHDIRNILIAQIGLSTFYCALLIYAPFKMGEVGIDITKYLGIILPLALLNFIFIPPLLGHTEDELKNEKQILILGFLGLIIMLTIIAFTNSKDLLTWAIIIFLSRTFASITDTSISSYLFKHIEERDVGIVSIQVACQNLPYLVVTPIFGLLIMKYFGLKILFLSVSIFLCFVLLFVSNIKQNYAYEHHKKNRLIQQKAKQKASQA